jgi:predicted adenylyl cyclase CyaB
MPSNIEIKARLRDRAKVEAIVARISDRGPELIQQKDVFFSCGGGRSESARLKLRIFNADSGELIRYERPNSPNARCSRYLIARTADPETLLEILTQTLGQLGVVQKTRTLYLIGQTRVHLDQVDHLGDFLELEVVLRPDQSEQQEGRKISEELLSLLQIDRTDLVAEAYIDLLANSAIISTEVTS